MEHTPVESKVMVSWVSGIRQRVQYRIRLTAFGMLRYSTARRYFYCQEFLEVISMAIRAQSYQLRMNPEVMDELRRKAKVLGVSQGEVIRLGLECQGQGQGQGVLPPFDGDYRLVEDGDEEGGDDEETADEIGEDEDEES
jgi:hypothetical protein